MQLSDANHALLFDSQVLRAKIAIRDHYIRKVVREIYENSGQLLSLVRIQLATLKNQTEDELSDRISASGELVGDVIRNLKEMSRNFSPEEDIMSESGIVNALKRELHNETALKARITVKGIPFAILPDPGLIYFHLILDVAMLITALYGPDSLTMEIKYTHADLNILMKYLINSTGPDSEHALKSETEKLRRLEIEERIKLINGKLTIRRRYNNMGKIEISMPYSA